MSTIKKQARVQRSARRKDAQRRHRVNVRNKQDNRERVTTAAGLFVAYIREQGYVRDRDSGKYTKQMANGDTHTIVMDYVPGKSALLIINEGWGLPGEYGEYAHSVHCEECPLPEKTVQYLSRKRSAAAARARQSKRPVPQWKRDLKDAAEVVKDTAVIDELRSLLGGKE